MVTGVWDFVSISLSAASEGLTVVGVVLLVAVTSVAELLVVSSAATRLAHSKLVPIIREAAPNLALFKRYIFFIIQHLHNLLLNKNKQVYYITKF